MEGEDTSSDLGRDKELCPVRENHGEGEQTAVRRSKLWLCVSREVLWFILSFDPTDGVKRAILSEVRSDQKKPSPLREQLSVF